MASTRDSNKRCTNGGEPSAKRSKSKYSSNNMFTVLVGPQEESFSVHKTTICAKSPFFAAACSGRWAEINDEGIVRLPEAQVSAFDAFLDFVYSGKIDLAAMDDLDGCFQLCHLWILSDYLQCHNLGNKIIDHIMWKVHLRTLSATWPIEQLREVWELVPSGTNLRRLAIDLAAAHATLEDLKSGGDQWPKDLLLAMATAHLTRKAEEEEKKRRTTTRSQGHGQGLDVTGGLSTAPLKPSYANRRYHHEHEDGQARCGGVFDIEEDEEDFEDLNDEEWPVPGGMLNFGDGFVLRREAVNDPP